MGCCGWGGTDRPPDGPPPPSPGAELIGRHRSQAAVELTAATGGGSLCRADGQPGVKRSEGAVAALSELHRAVTRSSTEDPLGVATTTLESWRLQRANSEHLGPVWRTYRDGGIAALRRSSRSWARRDIRSPDRW